MTVRSNLTYIKNKHTHFQKPKNIPSFREINEYNGHTHFIAASGHRQGKSKQGICEQCFVHMNTNSHKTLYILWRCS